MHMLDVALLLIVCLAYLLLGAFVLANNPRASLNRILAFLSFALVAWSTVAFLEDAGHSLAVTRILVKADFVLAVLLMWLFYLFCYELYRKKLKLLTGLVAALGVLSLAFTLTDNTVGIEINSGHVDFVPKVGYQIFLLFAILSLLGGLILLIIRHQHSSGRLKAQVKLIFFGLFLTSLFITLTNVILPNLVRVSPQITRVGIYSSLFFIGFSAYTIIKHRFLDIRLLVARSVAYILLVVSLGATFAATLFGLTTLFVERERVDTSIMVMYLVLALVLAFLFPHLKRIFDRFSDSIFYRDAYDTQNLIDTLNNALVTTIDLEDLLIKSSKIIKNTLKLEFCVFAVHSSDKQIAELIGTGAHHLSEEKVESIKKASHSISKNVVVADESEASAPKLKELLKQDGIGVLVRLEGTSVSHSPSPGYMVLGQKSSGSIYSSQDVKNVEILADELVIAIQNSLRFEEIQRFNITLQEKIKEATAELRRVNVRLRQLDKSKDEFISMASHQLRTPLTTVKGYLSMVLEGDVGPVTKAEKEYIKKAFDGAQKMVYLIADLLNVSRLQTGKFVIENQPTHLAEVVEGEIAQLQETAVNHKLKLIYHKPKNFPSLNLDENKIRQVVMNFLDNALYYTPAGGSVTAELTASDSEVTFTVTDTGIGVPAAVQHRLFSKFYRANNARKTRPDGTGLGLFMAKKVIAAQGGSIIFKSTEGKGSTFGFSFPRHITEIKESTKSPAKTKTQKEKAAAK